MIADPNKPATLGDLMALENRLLDRIAQIEKQVGLDQLRPSMHEVLAREGYVVGKKD